MYAQEHAPMIGNRRMSNSMLCHRGNSRICTCGGDAPKRKIDRRLMKRSKAARRELMEALAV